MFDATTLKNFIDKKDFDGARKYLITNIDELLEKHIPNYTHDILIDISQLHPKITGILMTYSIILEDESSNQELIISRLMGCYNALLQIFQENDKKDEEI